MTDLTLERGEAAVLLVPQGKLSLCSVGGGQGPNHFAVVFRPTKGEDEVLARTSLTDHSVLLSFLGIARDVIASRKPE
jgi:hypothetical protein